MAEVKWIKITTNMFEDEKIDFIESLPEADSILVIWIKLLTLAGKNNVGGYIFLTEKIPYTSEMLAHRFRRPLNTVKFALETLRKLEMIEFNDVTLKITNWEKHQNVEGMDKIREQTRKRVARHREKKALLEEGNVTGNDSVTQGNETDIDIDIEEEGEEEREIDIIMTPHEAEYISVLENIEGYPLDRRKDLSYMKQLEKRYPSLDLTEAIKKFSIYILDNPFRKNANHRSQINTSFGKYVEWNACLKVVEAEPRKLKMVFRDGI